MEQILENQKKNDTNKSLDFQNASSRRINEELNYTLDKFLKLSEVNFENFRNEQNELHYRQEKYYEMLIHQLKEVTNQNSKYPDYLPKQLETPNWDPNSKFEILEAVESLKKDIQKINYKKLSDHSSIYANPNNQIFIRELYHYLMTPLVQIEAKTIIFDQTSPGKLETSSEKLKETNERIKASVEICKSVLAAYRELAFITSSSEWATNSLSKSLYAAAKLYQDTFHKTISAKIDLPNNFESFSNNFIMAITLPLLENAIKASPSEKEITVNHHIQDNHIVITIQNHAVNPPSLSNLKTDGFSTKKNHEGTGLRIVRNLLESQNKGSINFTVQDDLILATIKLTKS